MPRTAPTDRGREFISGVLQHLPDHLRSGMEEYLNSPDAATFATQIGSGVLRQDEFSRQLDSLAAERNALKTWHDQLAEYQQTHLDGGGPAGPGGTTRRPADPDPAAATAAAGGITQEHIQELLNTELGRRETYVAAFVADSMKLAQEHLQKFGEVLDVQTILNHPRLGELRLRGAYEDLFKDKLAAHNADLAAKAHQKLEAEIRAKVVAELSAAGGGAPPLYPIGDSPLDHLTQPGETPKAWDPANAARLYDQLVSAKQG